MSNKKYLPDILKVCSVLPALVIMPAMADLPNTSGNAWVFGDLNLGYDVANNSAIGGRVSVINGVRGNDFPEYNVVGRSVKISGTAGKKTRLYVGPVDLTLRELGKDEAFVYNWQTAGTPGESNWADAELQEGEVSYKDFDIAKQAGLVWNDSVETIIEKTGFDVSQDKNYYSMAYGLHLFANRDNTAAAGDFSADNVNLTLDGTNVVANNVVISASNLTIANANVPKNILNGLHNASDGYTSIGAENFVVLNGSRIDVENGATLDLSKSDDTVFSSDDVNHMVKLYNNGTVKFGGDVLFKNAVLHNTYSLTNEQKKIIYNGDDDITFVNTKISNPGQDYNGNAIVGGLVEFKTTGDISFSGDRVDTGSGAFINSTVLSDMIFQADKISVSGGSADVYAGAIFNAGNMSFLAKENLFTDNHQTDIASESKYYKLGGGALYNRGTEYTAKMTIGFADGSSKNTFTSNTALQNGGAIESRTDDPNSSAVVDIIGTTLFSKNEAGVNGGAIMNWTDADATSSTTVNFAGNVTFNDNFAGDLGGAIYNGGTGATVDLSDAVAVFNGNKSIVDGGAIYNDTDAVLKIGDAKFINNHASYDSWDSEGYGGAIFALGDLDIVSTKANGVIFSNNAAFSGGAVYGSKNSNMGMNIENALFDGNHAIADAGALGIFNNAMSKVTGTVFRNNTVAVSVDNLIVQDDIKEADGGGAIQLGGTASATLTDTHFVGNESGVRGGAISARHGKDYELNVSKSSFTKNIAGTNGGAIAHVFTGELNVENTNFYSNIAGKSGGAIYNGADWNFGGKPEAALSTGDGIVNISGENMFSGNIATEFGGAIFNGEKGTLNMAGTNTFVNNFAAGGANDIHNDGMFTVVSGTTTMDGGITGSGTLDIAEGATLNMNYASIEQSAINIDGTLMASMLNANDKVDITGALSGTGNVMLNVGATGVYDLGELKSFITKDSFGKVYNVSLDENNVATLTAKSVSDIVASTGITSGAAGVVSAFTESTDAKLQQVSLAVQEALNSGNTALVEKEMAKVNPDSKPVTQSVAASVQGQVLTVASGRMSSVGGVASGRSGGDVASAGVWAPGLVNKSKLNGQFNGHTRGFALGADTVVDKVYTIGAGFAYSDTDINANGGNTSVESNSVFAYAQYKPANWYINATMNYTMSEYTDETNVMGFAFDNQYDADAFGVQAMYGYDLASGITPEFGMRYLHVSQDAHQDVLGRTIAEMNTNFLSVVTGVNYAFVIDTDTAVKFSPTLRAAMTYDVVSENAIATVMVPGSSTYFVDVENLSRLGGEFGIGLTAEWRGLEMSLNYELDLHEDYTSQTGILKFRYDF